MQDLDQYLDNVFKMFAQKSYSDYHDLPSELDEKIREFVHVYLQASPAERKLILSRVNETHSFKFIIFAERAAALGVREQSRQRLLEGLVALLIEGFKFDMRDTLKRFAPLYHSATKIGVDPADLFNEAASYADNEVARTMTEFPSRKPEDRGLSAFLYKEVNAPDGFRYESVY
jgi:hypothetical protein